MNKSVIKIRFYKFVMVVLILSNGYLLIQNNQQRYAIHDLQWKETRYVPALKGLAYYLKNSPLTSDQVRELANLRHKVSYPNDLEPYWVDGELNDYISSLEFSFLPSKKIKAITFHYSDISKEDYKGLDSSGP